MREIGPEIEAMAGEAAPGYSSGGMVTKLAAARIAMGAGCHMLIAHGKSADPPLAAIEEGARATLFLPRGEPAPFPWAISMWQPALIAIRAAASLVTIPPEL